MQLFSEALRNPRIRETVRTAWDDLLARFAEIVRRGQAQAELHPAMEPGAAARLLVAAYVGLLVQKVMDPDVDVPKYAEALRALYRGDFRRGGSPTSDGKS